MDPQIIVYGSQVDKISPNIFTSSLKKNETIDMPAQLSIQIETSHYSCPVGLMLDNAYTTHTVEWLDWLDDLMGSDAKVLRDVIQCLIIIMPDIWAINEFKQFVEPFSKLSELWNDEHISNSQGKDVYQWDGMACVIIPTNNDTTLVQIEEFDNLFTGTGFEVIFNPDPRVNSESETYGLDSLIESIHCTPWRSAELKKIDVKVNEFDEDHVLDKEPDFSEVERLESILNEVKLARESVNGDSEKANELAKKIVDKLTK